jgi:hypothetical protein
MRRDVIQDNLLTRIKIDKHGDYLSKFEQKQDVFCEQRAKVRLKPIGMHHNTFHLYKRKKNYAWIYAGLGDFERGLATYEYREYKDFSTDRTSPVLVRDLNQEFEINGYSIRDSNYKLFLMNSYMLHTMYWREQHKK